ncbi:MAG: flagellar motor protein MotB [Vicinamibacterales bacterium]
MKPKSGEAVIVVKKVSAHAAHHGGAWKVAYADFVTALMAFFLVMWLVGQSKEVRASVAGYFRDPGVFDYQKSRGILPGGTPGAEPGRAPEVASKNSQSLEHERQVLTQAAEHIRQHLVARPELGALRDQIELKVTAEGLRIELVERTGSSFFDSGSAVLRGESERMLTIIAKELGTLANDIVVEGHTDSHKFQKDDRYGNWELSADRANAARRVMERDGLHPGQLRTVRGFADTELKLVDPFDPRNRRVSIVVRSQAAASLQDSIAQDQ